MVVWAIYLLKAHVAFRLYPAIVVGVFLAVFLFSLFRKPFVEIAAERMGEHLDEHGIAHCRKATIAWAIFLSMHLAVTIATIFMSAKVWAVYNGFVAYLLLGAMFAGEYLVRRRCRRV